MPLDVEGATSWTRRWWRALLAEVVATALLVLLGVASLLHPSATLTHPALAFAFIVTANVQAFGAISGAHMNPAVTLAALVYGQLSVGLAAAYVLAQTAGALVGYGALAALLLPAGHVTGCTTPDVPPPAAALLEAVLTGTLALACCGVWATHDPARPDHAAPLKLGLTVGGLVYAGGPFTGASLNPARSFAPAVVSGIWDHHWVYWAGPLCGAGVAAALHRWVLSPRPPPPRAHEELPLRDKPDH